MRGRRILVGLLTVLSLAVLTTGPALADSVGPYDVTYIGYQYDYPEEGQSTWYYTVTSTTTCGAISHIVFGMEVCCSVVGAGEWEGTWPDSIILQPLWQEGDEEEQGGVYVGCDPPTSVCGIKFDEGFGDYLETRNYYFTIEGNHPEAEDIIRVAVKAGRECPAASQVLVSEAVLAGQDFTTYEAFVDGPYLDCGTTAITLSSLSATAPSGSSVPAVSIPVALLGASVLAAGAMVLIGRRRRQEV